MMLHLKKDQSVDQAVQESMQPRTQFFLGVQLPPRVPKAQYKDGLGASTLTERGIQPGAKPSQNQENKASPRGNNGGQHVRALGHQDMRARGDRAA